MAAPEHMVQSLHHFHFAELSGATLPDRLPSEGPHCPAMRTEVVNIPSLRAPATGKVQKDIWCMIQRV